MESHRLMLDGRNGEPKATVGGCIGPGVPPGEWQSKPRASRRWCEKKARRAEMRWGRGLRAIPRTNPAALPNEIAPLTAASTGDPLPHATGGPGAALMGVPLLVAATAAVVGWIHASLAERPLPLSAADPIRTIVETRSVQRAGGTGNGSDHRPHRPTEGLSEPGGSEPLWRRLRAVSANGSGALALPRSHSPALADRGGARLRNVGALLRAALVSRADVAVTFALLAGVGIVQASNMLHWPGALFDEGTNVANAWAVQHGALAPYTYSYLHPPLGWLLIFLWSSARGVFGSGAYSIDNGREFMLVVSLISCSLLYTLARRFGLGRAFAAGAVILFALSPLAVFFHRAVLLDNPAIAWALAAFVLARTPDRRIWAFAASGACFGAAVLSQETTVVLLPALVVAAVQNADPRTRRYCLTLFASSLTMVAVVYPLYATLKGELLPGPGHVSLAGQLIAQLSASRAGGSVFDPHSTTHATVMSWLQQDPWLLAAALVFSPIALAQRRTRAIALAFIIPGAIVLRPGYLPNTYVIGLLPFAALIVAGSSETLWHGWQRIASRGSRLALGVLSGALAFPLVLAAAAQWTHGDRVAMVLRADDPARAAEGWLVGHVGHQQRLIVSDPYWIYLIEHGFDSRPVRGGFYSRTVVSYWPLDHDPAVRRFFPQGWRDFDYIVSTEPMRLSVDRTPQTALALEHSRIVVSFGHGTQRIEIRAITERTNPRFAAPFRIVNPLPARATPPPLGAQADAASRAAANQPKSTAQPPSKPGTATLGTAADSQNSIRLTAFQRRSSAHTGSPCFCQR